MHLPHSHSCATGIAIMLIMAALAGAWRWRTAAVNGERRRDLRRSPALILSGFDPNGGTMNEDAFNKSVRKFLKKVGITAQREIETAVREALSKGSLTGNEKLLAKITLTLGQTSLSLVVDGKIELE
jgi:Family of unknown function (DUF6494)